MNKKKKLKFWISSEYKLSSETMNQLKEALRKFEQGEADALVVNQAHKVAIFDENNEYIMTL